MSIDLAASNRFRVVSLAHGLIFPYTADVCFALITASGAVSESEYFFLTVPNKNSSEYQIGDEWLLSRVEPAELLKEPAND